MNGFIDVSTMTNAQVRSMGHADDCGRGEGVWRNAWAYRKPVQKTAPIALNYNAEDVWGASWQAFVQNDNQCIKAVAPELPYHETNRMIVEKLLSDTTQITQESLDQGLIIQRYFHGLTFKLIEGKSLTPFLQGAYDAAAKDIITTKFELAIIASLPATYEKMTMRDAIERRVRWASGGSVGVVGDKVCTTVEIVKSVFSQKWNTWYITGINDLDQAVFFSFKKDMVIGSRAKIMGTVKVTRDDVTKLSRVKVI